ncbi:hypothetical protein [Halomonas sp. 328]|uniref:hypothetical protein n=1 Tax=Halomonas sp. 328 TaxID=2776704 RepID=UPI0018A79BF3|nr:hypothetical protein [Halomonas sp. 328]MBF8224188.1 hypothetical protein [Halomonas sp. 328]
MTVKPLLNLLLALGLIGGMAKADMLIDRSIIEFTPGQPPRHDVIVTNTALTPLFVETSVIAVSDPGTPHERRERLRTPETAGLVASPQRLMIPPQGRRRVRLVNLEGHGDMERVYRVNLTPHASPMPAAQGLTLRVQVGYQLLVLIAPTTARVELESQRHGQRLLLVNHGNTNLQLSEARQCAPHSPQHCERLPNRRLYPGNRLELPLPFDSAVEFTLVGGGQHASRRVD